MSNSRVKAAILHSHPTASRDLIKIMSTLIRDISQIVPLNGIELLVVPQFGFLEPIFLEWIDNGGEVPKSTFQTAVEQAIDIKSSEFKSVLDTAKRFSVHLVFPFIEKNSAETSLYRAQCIINNQGKISLIRRDLELTLQDDDNRASLRIASDLDRTFPNEQTVVRLPFKSGVYETGILSLWEHLKPLSIQNSSVQYEKIHIAFIDPLKFRKYSSNFDFHSLCGSYSQQTQTFGLIASTDSRISSLFHPDGSKILSDSNGKVSIFDMDMKKVLYQKTFLDSMGHFSRPDMVSLDIIVESDFYNVAL